jgi:membrane-bound lytic murein transglycosylase F
MRPVGAVRGLALLAAALAAAPRVLASADDLPAIRERGTLRVLYSESRPETITLKPGVEPGIERELIEGFAGLNRLKVEFVAATAAADRVQGLLTGKGDLAVGLGVTDERRRLGLEFSSETFPTRHLVVTRRPRAPITTLEQLRKVKVGTVKGSSWAATVASANLPPENVDTSFATPEDVLEGLRKGQIAALVMPVDWAMLEMRKDPQLELGLYLGDPVGRAWAIRKGSPQLLAALNDYIANVHRSGAWSRLVVKYYGAMTLEALQKSRSAP